MLDLTSHLNVRAKLGGSSWLLTGGNGFLGSVLIEQLLRTCAPSKIVLVILPKKGESALHQVEKLLARPLYNNVRQQYGGTQALLSKFEVIEQDLSDVDELHFPVVDYVVHAAASISFNNHIHEAINANYKATQLVSAAAAAMPGLKAFVHVSTCYVNGNLPRGTHVPETMYPLAPPSHLKECQEVVGEMMAMPREEAEDQAKAYRKMWGFPNNYAMTKRLAEHLLADRYKAGLPLRIVRPSIIGGTSLHHVMPGYIGNAGGSTGFAIGIACGMWACTEFKPDNTTDIIPADFVSSAIIVAAAVEAAQNAPLPPIFQSATAGVDPMLNREFYEAVMRMDRVRPAPIRVFSGYPKPTMEDIHCRTHEESVRALRRNDSSIRLRTLALKLAGQGATARAMATRWKVFKVVSDPAMDFHLFFACDNLAAAYKALSPEERQLYPCVWQRGVDLWRPYLDAYMAEVWERYVSRAAGKAGKGGLLSLHPWSPWLLAAIGMSVALQLFIMYSPPLAGMLKTAA